MIQNDINACLVKTTKMSQNSLDNFTLNDEQQDALEAFEDGKSFLLTGPAGTGIITFYDD